MCAVLNSMDEILCSLPPTCPGYKSSLLSSVPTQYRTVRYILRETTHSRNLYYSILLQLFYFIINHYCESLVYLIYKLNFIIAMYVQEQHSVTHRIWQYPRFQASMWGWRCLEMYPQVWQGAGDMDCYIFHNKLPGLMI